MFKPYPAPANRQYQPLLPEWVMELKEKQRQRDIRNAVRESKILRERNLRAMALTH